MAQHYSAENPPQVPPHLNRLVNTLSTEIATHQVPFQTPRDNSRIVGDSEVIRKRDNNRCRCKAAFNCVFEATKLRRSIIPVSMSPCFSRAGKGQAYAGWKCDS